MREGQTIGGHLMFYDGPEAYLTIDPEHVADLARWR